MKFKLLKESQFKFYTNGVKTIRLKDGETPPEGFYPGRTFNSNPWNKGLTSETSDKVKEIGAKTKETRKVNNSYVSWNTGLTKETSDILKQVSIKNSESKKGSIPWNKGIPATDAQKQKQSQAMMGTEPYNKGRTKNDCDSLMSTSQKLMGHLCYVTDWEEAKRKEYLTKKLNKSFNTSKPEKELIQSLIDEFGSDDIIAPYRDSRYPFNCDAYIKSLDLFIEFNGTVEHHGHPFDPNNSNDIAELDKLKQKANEKPHPNRYDNIIDWWTIKDPKKLDTLRKNKLNFKIIYPNGLIITE